MMPRGGTRPRVRAATLLFGVAAAALTASCSPAPEEALIQQFFRAVQQEDRVSSSGLSMVPFPGGPLESWEVVEIGEETEGPYRVPELVLEETAGEAARDEQFKIFYDFRQANQSALQDIVSRREGNPEAAIGGQLGEIAAAWDAHQAERNRLVSSLSEVQMALDEERRRTQRGLLREAPVDYLTGNISEKDVRVRTVEEGEAREYQFTLIRYNLVNQFDVEVAARWIIAGIEASEPGTATEGARAQ